jgi:L-lactate dehydrogenase complex protein LldG
MSSRDRILENVRRRQPAATSPPESSGPWTTYPDPAARFAETLAGIGGTCLTAGTAADLNEQLARLPAYAEAERIVSLVPGVGRPASDAGADLDAGAGTEDDPHGFADVDFAVLPGQLAVAENAAVWVTDEAVRPRVLYFLPQHVALVVPADRVVSNMHQAYRWLAGHPPAGSGGPFARAGFSAWIAGPSKTADIEQSLVIGAHGARSMTVCLLGDPLE